MTRYRNFAHQPTPPVIDTEYEVCNFCQSGPIDVGGLKRGVRLFPGDDTPRTFRRCNLVNAEVPPGSTVVDCNTTIAEFDVVDPLRQESITIDGVQMTLDHHNHVVHGRWNPDIGDYDDLPTPEITVRD